MDSIDEILRGVWTYRSFHNTPEPVEDFNVLRFGQGELTFDTPAEAGTLSGQLAFLSPQPAPDDPRLTIRGATHAAGGLDLRFQGTGNPSTGAKGWIYDYVGQVVPSWPHAESQRAAIVGSVIRTAPHDGRPAGYVGSFVAVKRDFLEPREVIPLTPPVVAYLASRQMRLHHTAWHFVRNSWLGLSASQKKEIDGLHWAPERPSLSALGDPLISNGSGEDFLFMHRAMIAEVKAIQAKEGADPIQHWSTIPPPQSAIDPVGVSGNPGGFFVPPVWPGWAVDVADFRRMSALKSDEYYWSRMRPWDRQFKDPQYLRQLTLGELGALLEWGVHNDMHMRWASPPVNPSTGKAQEREPGDLAPSWDDPKFDYLGDFYSSHVNPVFWRLHGWVDDRVADWERAHTDAGHDIKKKTVAGLDWYEKGAWITAESPWTGPSHNHDVVTMERVVGIITKRTSLTAMRRRVPLGVRRVLAF